MREHLNHLINSVKLMGPIYWSHHRIRCVLLNTLFICKTIIFHCRFQINIYLQLALLLVVLESFKPLTFHLCVTCVMMIIMTELETSSKNKIFFKFITMFLGLLTYIYHNRLLWLVQNAISCYRCYDYYSLLKLTKVTTDYYRLI